MYVTEVIVCFGQINNMCFTLTLICYLYLQNKTFINSHLIKSGLVDVDNDLEYKYKTKFLELKGVVNG